MVETIWKSIENCFRNQCQKSHTILLRVIRLENKLWTVKLLPLNLKSKIPSCVLSICPLEKMSCTSHILFYNSRKPSWKIIGLIWIWSGLKKNWNWTCNKYYTIVYWWYNMKMTISNSKYTAILNTNEKFQAILFWRCNFYHSSWKGWYLVVTIFD